VRTERGWIKTKNRDYWRWELEREGALSRRRVRKFVLLRLEPRVTGRFSVVRLRAAW
jgi:hypothetical protein